MTSYQDLADEMSDSELRQQIQKREQKIERLQFEVDKFEEELESRQ